MTVRVAINGYGRIGRNILRAHLRERQVARPRDRRVNDLGPPETNAHLTRYDTAHGKFPGNGGGRRRHDGRERRPHQGARAARPGAASVGLARRRRGAREHRLFHDEGKGLGAPQGRREEGHHLGAGGKDVDATVVYGVNHQTLKASHTVISNASCTTNCLAPLVKPLHEAIGVVNGLMTTIHSYTNDQVLTDVFHEDLRRARSATMSMIPTKTGAAAAVGLVLPELNGKLDGFAMRVPTINVSSWTSPSSPHATPPSTR
jgi:glyceraldehyde 3-phosphate dehydrogenase